jgi:phage shock protein C
MIAGVCGGIGDYFDVDPTVVRLAAVLLAMAGGPGLIIYIILAVIIPEEPIGYEKRKNPFEE